MLKHVGVTLESVRRCGAVNSTFIDIERVRAVIINEASGRRRRAHGPAA